MKVVRGIALPDTDTHFASMIDAGPMVGGKGTYQLAKLQPAVALCKRRGLAIDIGAHVGLWSRVLAGMFEKVIAFEPVPEHIECFKANIAGQDNVTLHPWAVGASEGSIQIARTAGNSGNCRVDESGDVAAHCCMIDKVHLGGEPVDFIKIDVEGSELFVVQGALETITTDWPVIVCEQKPGNAERYGLGQTDAVKLLCKWGYKVAWEKVGDYCLVP
jgi:FkbM family methyltransferase